MFLRVASTMYCIGFCKPVLFAGAAFHSWEPSLPVIPFCLSLLLSLESSLKPTGLAAKILWLESSEQCFQCPVCQILAPHLGWDLCMYGLCLCMGKWGAECVICLWGDGCAKWGSSESSLEGSQLSGAEKKEKEAESHTAMECS